MMTRLAAATLVLLVTAAHAAPSLELAGKAIGARTSLAQRRVGEARYMAIADVYYQDRSAYCEVLDLETRAVIQVRASRALFETRFGRMRERGVAVPRADIVMYKPGVVGLLVAESTDASDDAQQYWYAELGEKTGKLLRSVELAELPPSQHVQIVGVDPADNAAWFAIASHTSGGARSSAAGAAESIAGKDVVLRRLDLARLTTSDELRVKRVARRGEQREPRVHAAPDFARFAVVDYYEEHVRMAPGSVYVVERATGAAFSVPAPPAAYGVAFARDGRFVYIGSAQRGTITRIDVAARGIDKTVAGPRFLHHLVISPRGTKLFALASSRKYVVYDLPDLKARTDADHVTGIAAAMAQLFGNGLASSDGAFFVAPDVDEGSDRRPYIIAHLLD